MKKYIDKDNKMLCIFDIVFIILLIVSFVGDKLYDAKYYFFIFDYMSTCLMIRGVVMLGFSIYKMAKSITKKKYNYLLVPICNIVILIALLFYFILC